MSDCERTRDDLEPWLKGDLAPRDAAAVDAHVKACADCRRELDWLRPVLADLATLPAPAADDAAADALADRVLARARAERTPPPGVGIAIGATLFGLLVAAGLLLRTSSPPPPAAPAPTATPAPPPPATERPVEPPPVGVEPPPPPAVEAVPPPVEPAGATEAPAPATEPSPPPPPDVVVEAPAATGPTLVEASTPRLHVLSGFAQVSRAGGRAMELRPGALLHEGDEVLAGGPTVLAVLAPGEVVAGWSPDALVLGPGARARVPAEPAVLRLDVGACFVTAGAEVTLVTPRGPVVVAGVADLEVGGGDRVEVTARGGRVSFAGDAVALGEVRWVDRQGRPGRDDAKDPAPRWADALGAPRGQVIAAFPGALPVLVGTRGPHGLAAGKGPLTDATVKVVCLGEADASRGVARHAPGLRLRVEYRLSAVVPLGVQVTSVTQGRNFQAVLERPRAGAWTWLELPLEELVDEARGGARLAPGDELDFLTISAHRAADVALDVRTVRLER